MLAIWSILCGFCSAMLGVGYRIGSADKVFPLQTVSAVSVAGMILFGWWGRGEWSGAPMSVYVIGILLGGSQYVVIRLMRTALQWGPLSPLWCAVMLNFIPVIIYSSLFLHEPMSRWQLLSVVTAAGAVIAASRSGQSVPRKPPAQAVATATATGGRSRVQTTITGIFSRPAVRYGILLALITISSGVTAVCLKISGAIAAPDGRMLSESYRNILVFMLYFFLLLPAVIDLSYCRSWRWKARGFYTGALVGSVGSLAGLWLQIRLMVEPAALVFPLTSSASILCASLTSTIFFGEKRTLSWLLTIIFALAAIACSKMDELGVL